ncbi:U2 snRNP complex subunit CUS1 [Rhodotorula paludigena]|uniref:U2 snRNP complex subunit CUS1 n=1 Tax=Rhodotorula paludigena TaxID=86838 RepID=UPI003175A8E7
MAAATAAPAVNGSAAISTANKSRGQLKRLKKKAKGGKAAGTNQESPANDNRPRERAPTQEPVEAFEDVKVKVEDGDASSIPGAFAEVFAHFQLPGEDVKVENDGGVVDGKGQVIYSDDEMPSEDDEEPAELSKRKQRKLNRLSVAELKRLVKKPEVVEWVDVSATDPRLLVQIKSHRNTVPIPAHWSQKRDYLQGKRGIEKPQFQLPSFIADTGIATQRDAVKEKEEQQSLKQKTRERVQPKMGKIDIDYQKLHDAFFKYQTKPKMSEFGEVYYEGKEYETKLKEKKPGDLSDELKEALSIPPLAPPPWLISMQRYGPPPSYPNLRIAGLNAPIPEGAAWGFHPGGWGKPPLDEYGRPLYGDIYGVAPQGPDGQSGEPIEREPWGELEPDEEVSEEEDEDDEEEEDEGDDDGEPAPGDGLQTPSGLETPSGLASVTSTVPGGLETPDFIELRKRREETQPEADGPRSLYQVLPERETRMRGFMGSDRVYDVSGISQAAGPPVLGQEERSSTKRKAGGVDVAIDAAELEGLSEADLRSRYEQANRSGRPQHEDFSDFAAAEVAKRRKMAESKKRDQPKEKFKF